MPPQSVFELPSSDLKIDALDGKGTISTEHPVIASPGCAKGIKSAVFLAAWIPAILATAMASPFFKVAELSAEKVVAVEKWRVHNAVAERVVGVLWVMETMCASPRVLRCVRVGAGGDGEIKFDASGEDGSCVVEGLFPFICGVVGDLASSMGVGLAEQVEKGRADGTDLDRRCTGTGCQCEEDCRGGRRG
jgi:hypothetical protein